MGCNLLLQKSSGSADAVQERPSTSTNNSELFVTAVSEQMETASSQFEVQPIADAEEQNVSCDETREKQDKQEDIKELSQIVSEMEETEEEGEVNHDNDDDDNDDDIKSESEGKEYLTVYLLVTFYLHVH